MKKLAGILAVVASFMLIISNASFSQNDAMEKAQSDFNIEGVFSCDFNGKYYIRQIGNEVLWFGEDDNINPNWSNVAHGTINGDMINLIWADVPKGSIMQHGRLVLRIVSNDKLEQVSQEGDTFGSNVWDSVTQY